MNKLLTDIISTGYYFVAGTGGFYYSNNACEKFENPIVSQFANDHLNDITLSFSLYFLLRVVTPITSKVKRAGVAFAVASLAEISYGTYDPKDFVAYAAGISLAMLVDRLTFGKKSIDMIIDPPPLQEERVSFF